jgi:hypothetical protein
MEMKIFKIIGWLLFLFGLFLVFFAIFWGVLVFNKQKNLPKFIEIKEKPEKQILKKEIPKTPQDVQKMVEIALQERMEEILPKEIVERLINFLVFSIFLGILIGGGGKISEIGLKILWKR